MASAMDVAKLFLSWANKEGDLISNLKMQKLLYYAQAWHLVHFKKPLFAEAIEAWEFGPVVTTAYHAFKQFGYNSIRYDETNKEKKKFTGNQLEFLEACYDAFMKFSAHELVNMVHNETPWKKAFTSKQQKKRISHKSMQDYYSKLLKKK